MREWRILYLIDDDTSVSRSRPSPTVATPTEHDRTTGVEQVAERHLSLRPPATRTPRPPEHRHSHPSQTTNAQVNDLGVRLWS
jgi:hypothetical protein